jgi:hypothetical protein
LSSCWATHFPVSPSSVAGGLKTYGVSRIKWSKTFLIQGKYLRAKQNAERLHGTCLRVVRHEQSLLRSGIPYNLIVLIGSV